MQARRSQGHAPSSSPAGRQRPRMQHRVCHREQLPQHRRQSSAAQATQRPPAPPDYKDRITRQFDDRAPGYDDDPSYHAPLALEVVEAAALRPGERVLDVGAGTGLVTLPAAQRVGPSGSVLALDLSQPMLDKAAAKARDLGLSNCTFVAADAEEYLRASTDAQGEGSLLREQFDAILCSNALPFLLDIPGALATWRAHWLRDGGRVVFNTPMNAFSRSFLLYAEAVAQHVDLQVRDPASVFPNPEEAERVMRAAGYTSVTVRSKQLERTQRGRTAEQWAAGMWRAWSGFAALPLAEVLPPEQLAQVEASFMSRAVEYARGLERREADGGTCITEPFVMLLVVGSK